MKKILFITLSNIGDAIMTTPTLERLHQIYPDAVIDLVCDPRSQTLFEHCPYRGEIFLKIKSEKKKGLFRLIKQLRKTRYDLIVDLRTDGLTLLLRAKKRLTKWRHKAYGPHAVEDLISIIHPINPDKIIPPTKVWLSKENIAQANELTKSLKGNRWLAIGPGANWPPKVWDAENFAAVANAVKDKINGVIVIGSDQDKEYTSRVLSKLELPSLDLTGKTNLLTASAAIQKCCLFIGNDSGLGHLASTVETPSIIVFGPGKPERYHPWNSQSRWITGKDKQLKKLEPQKVIKVIKQLLF